MTSMDLAALTCSSQSSLRTTGTRYISCGTRSGVLPTVFNARNVHIARAEACSPVSIDSFELEKLSQLPFTKLLGGCSNALWLVAHHLFSRPVLMKIAEVSPVGSAKNETVVYAALEGTGMMPRFLAHVTESGRIVGFLVEFVEGRAADDRDFPACEKAPKRLHDEGLLHNDTHLGSFVVKPNGTVLLMDFEHAQPCEDQWRFEEDMVNVRISEG
ncbi:hypothetical protein DL766_010253 [Monosporascus sp. MC13-8B]|uniref:Aminoglycoside phosphotransferase domain-containing protein n=1 Tax=Monosporascus cannonballus TaxID=155416 RepID=A0ABY0HAA5_9PEZI|nr:hypothetical protein DL762_003539 [Monosporascus cannonballus]RYO96527.1 hypothetical protein DL763_003146 [Monosporascus cannonballus]RYP02709.1 hypothetical protein DL766_010253 [Monosporascus sp. MC13-8B]